MKVEIIKENLDEFKDITEGYKSSYVPEEGDRVKIIDRSQSMKDPEKYIGQVGTIIKVFSLYHTNDSVTVTFDDGSFDNFYNDSVESVNEDVSNTPIEDIDAFITEVKERFPGSEAFYDGDNNEIRISLR